MMRSMYSGVSGLRVHQTKMDTIGNNIANVNTVGFNRSTTTFQEVFSQTIQGAGSSQGGTGGTNPQQIGLGVSVASMTVDHSQGATQRTDYVTDLMIDGSGYFVVSNDVNYENRYFTRAGNFNLDEDGYLVASNGYKVLDENMQAIQINQAETKDATPTTEIDIKGNINVNDDEYTTTVDIYDSLGDVHTLTITFGDMTANAGETVSFREITITDEDGTDLFGGTHTDGARYAKFDSSGNYVFDSTDYDGGLVIGTSGTDADTAGDDIITIEIDGAEDIDLVINDKIFLSDSNDVLFTQYSSTSDAYGDAVDGNSAGSIYDFTISTTGEIVGIFTNGERETLATIGLADFDNPAGLLKAGDNTYIESPNSGTPNYGSPSTGSFGDLSPGALEMSNVDLSFEFTEMITTQRGFQANSRIITTADEMLQELVNLKG